MTNLFNKYNKWNEIGGGLANRIWNFIFTNNFKNTTRPSVHPFIHLLHFNSNQNSGKDMIFTRDFKPYDDFTGNITDGKFPENLRYI